MSQPKWCTLYQTDYSMIRIDKTGVYAPEMELAQDLENGTFEVFRFSLDRLKIVWHDGGAYMVTEAYATDWPHALPTYCEWFDDSLSDVARSYGTTEAELREALCSDDVKTRAWAYESIGWYHGFHNLDSYPLVLTEEEFNARWDKAA